MAKQIFSGQSPHKRNVLDLRIDHGNTSMQIGHATTGNQSSYYLLLLLN